MKKRAVSASTGGVESRLTTLIFLFASLLLHYCCNSGWNTSMTTSGNRFVVAALVRNDVVVVEEEEKGNNANSSHNMSSSSSSAAAANTSSTSTTTTTSSSSSSTTLDSGLVTSSKLQIHFPSSLTKPGGYDHREALFGIPPYGGTISQPLYYADNTACNYNAIDTHAGYPARSYEAEEENNNNSGESSPKMLPWPSPYILMVDRGGCTFVQKVRNAQRVGAAGVIIADDSCLCSMMDVCTPSDPDETCEEREPIMADDGSGSDISIPTFLMFKPDADKVKAEVMANHPVRIEMSWSLPNPDDRVEYELWTTPTDVLSADFQKDFKEAAVALGKRAYFTPQMYIYDGILSGCQDENGKNDCFNLCTNNGRYCATDPDNDLDRGVSGADVVEESLRRMCIWNHYGKDDGVGVPWWDYVQEFLFRCYDEEYFSSKQCVADAMAHANVDVATIDQCMSDSGGLQDDVENILLEAQLRAKDKSGVVILPAMYVNRVSIRGTLSLPVVLKAICSGYASGTVPSVCTSCASCPDEKECILNQGFCGSKKIQESVSTMNMIRALVAMSVIFCLFSYIQHRRYQSQMQTQVKNIIAEYMPLESDRNLNQGTSVSDEDREFT